MTDNEKQFEDFVRQIKFDDTPDPNHRDRLEQDLLQAMAKKAPRQARVWRMTMRSQIARIAAAALIAMGILVAFSFWPESGSQNGPFLWADVMAALDQIEVLIYRDRMEHAGRKRFIEVHCVVRIRVSHN
jgi:hypothetical protein